MERDGGVSVRELFKMVHRGEQDVWVYSCGGYVLSLRGPRSDGPDARERDAGAVV